MESGARVLAFHEHPNYRVELRADGILCYHARPGMMISRAIARQLLRDGVKLTSKPTRCLVLMEDVARIDREARIFFASEAYLRLATRMALVVGTPVSRVIGSFFVGLNRASYPIRIFTEVEPAVAWLRRDGCD